MDLNKAYINFFRIPGVRPPTYKKKGIHDSFGLEGIIKINEKSIQVPKLGKLRTFEKLPTNAKPKMCTISKTADRWFISFISDRSDITYESDGPPVGVDLGIKTLATLSDGKTFENPKAFNKYKDKLAIAQRRLAKKQLRSKNGRKVKAKVARIHYKIANIRKDSIHKLTTYLAKNHSEIFIEDLSVKSMLQTKGLAGSIADGAFYEIRRQLEYKSKKVNVIDRFYPSSQLCSSCGTKQKLKLSQRTYKCNNCNLIIDRDLNAAINILNYSGSARPEEPTVKSRN
jgi:putative transposase